MHNEALHAAVLAAPADDEPRSVYADWLLARGDPRGELIAVQLELARTRDSARRRTLLAEERELWRTHGHAWRPSVRGLGLDFERGFIAVVEADAALVDEHLDALLAWACLERLWLSGSISSELADRLAAGFEHMRLDTLGISRARISVDALAQLLAAPRLASLARLNMQLNDALTSEHLAVLASSTRLRELRALALRRDRLGPEAVAALARWAHPRSLERLELGHNPLGRSALAPLRHSLGLAGLTHLELENTGIGTEDVRALVDAQLPLETLDLAQNPLDDDAARLLAEAPQLARLRRLDLSATHISREGVAALIASPHLDRELVLHLAGEPLGLERIDYTDQGMVIETQWVGDVPAELTARFRVQLL